MIHHRRHALSGALMFATASVEHLMELIKKISFGIHSLDNKKCKCLGSLLKAVVHKSLIYSVWSLDSYHLCLLLVQGEIYPMESGDGAEDALMGRGMQP